MIAALIFEALGLVLEEAGQQPTQIFADYCPEPVEELARYKTTQCGFGRLHLNALY